MTSGFVAEAVVAGTFGFTVGELRQLASGAEPAIRAVRAGGTWRYCWADALLVAVATERRAEGGGHP